MNFFPKGILNSKISIYAILLKVCKIFIDNNLANILLN